jgi:hypothetical protein
MKEETKEFLTSLAILSVAGAAIGALTGLGLSSAALSPFVIGGVVAGVPAIFYACYIYDNIRKGELSKEDLFMPAWLCAASTTIGVGLAAAATAILPGAMLGMGPVVLTGTVIGPIAPIAGLSTTQHITAPIAEKVNEHIISPVIEHFFFSKGNGYDPA